MKRNEEPLKQYCLDIKDIEVLTPEEEKELFIKYKKNNDLEARDKLIISNLKLVRKMASKYQINQIPIDDIVQDANIYLFKLIDNFDIEKGYKFSTYAYACIYYRMQKIVDKYLSPDFGEKYKAETNKILTFYYEYIKVNGTKPTYQEIADETGMKVKKVEYLLSLLASNSSLNGVVQDNYYETENEDDFESLDIYMSYNYVKDESIDIEKEVYEKIDYELLKQHIINQKNLTAKQREIIILRLGLKESAKTYDEIANKLKISRNCVYETAKAGLEKIRANPKTKDFR